MRREYWIIALALLLRLVVLFLRPADLQQDRDGYLELAQHVAAGEGLVSGEPPHPTAFRPPFYPWLLAGVLILGGDRFAMGLLQAILGTAVCGMTYLLARRGVFGGDRSLTEGRSQFATLLVAVDPLLLQSTTLIMTEATCTALVAGLLLLSVPASHRVGLRALAWGLCFGTLCLCRPTFLLVLPLGTAINCLREWSVGGMLRGILSQARAIGWATVGMLCLIVPWTVRNAVYVGKATPATTHGGYTLLLGNNAEFYRQVISRDWSQAWDGSSLLPWQQSLEVQMAAEGIAANDEVVRDRWMYQQAWAEIRQQPGMFLQACAYRFISLFGIAPRGEQSRNLPRLVWWGIALFYTAEHVLAVWGALALFKQRRRQTDVPRFAETVGWSLLGAVIFAHLFYWTDLRMRTPIIPLIALLASRRLSLPTAFIEPD